MVWFAIPLSMELSVVMGVGSCLWPSYHSVLHITSTSCALVNKPPNYASAVEDVTFLEFQR